MPDIPSTYVHPLLKDVEPPSSTVTQYRFMKASYPYYCAPETFDEGGFWTAELLLINLVGKYDIGVGRGGSVRESSVAPNIVVGVEGPRGMVVPGKIQLAPVGLDPSKLTVGSLGPHFPVLQETKDGAGFGLTSGTTPVDVDLRAPKMHVMPAKGTAGWFVGKDKLYLIEGAWVGGMISGSCLEVGHRIADVARPGVERWVLSASPFCLSAVEPMPYGTAPEPVPRGAATTYDAMVMYADACADATRTYATKTGVSPESLRQIFVTSAYGTGISDVSSVE